MTGRSASGICGSDGSKSSYVAYVTKNEYVFQRTKSFRRRSSNGGHPKYIVSCRSSRATTQRIASAPTRSQASTRSTMFPPDLWNSSPGAASIGWNDSHTRYGASPVSTTEKKSCE